MSNPSLGPGAGPDHGQKKAINAVFSILETGKLPGPDAYRTCTILSDGAGISYGLHQATDRSGSVDACMVEYINRKGTFASELEPFLPLVSTNFSTKVDPEDPPQEVAQLVGLLRKCGRDPVMWEVQDEVFDRIYWRPTLDLGRDLRLQFPLSYLLIYDTVLQSGVECVWTIRKMFPASPPSLGGDEMAWATQYAAARLKWISDFRTSSKKKQALVRSTSYRMRSIIDEILSPGNWALRTPFTFRGKTVS